MSMEFASYDEAIARAIEEVPTSAPGERLVYSDINFFLLGEIVHRVSGKTLDEFCRTRIFEPLGMRDTMFKPPASLRAADRADREVHAVRLAVRPAGRRDPPRRRARPDGAAHAGRRRATRACSARPPTWRSSAGCCSTAGARAP